MALLIIALSHCEQEISDDISECLALHMGHPLQSASAGAQQKSYVTYTAPILGPNTAQITLLEAPSLLGSSGTTGFRTWEAALFLGTYLCSSEGNHFVTGKSVLELGAGTGFLSIVCAKYGAQHVLATDGSQEIISNLRLNMHLNELEGSELIQPAILPWGYTLIGGVADCREDKRSYDLVLGADVVSDFTRTSYGHQAFRPYKAQLAIGEEGSSPQGIRKADLRSRHMISGLSHH